MSTDPYHAVQQEIQSSLQTAGTLRASFLRIRSTAREDSEELIWARKEVRVWPLRWRRLNGLLRLTVVRGRSGDGGVAEGDARGFGGGPRGP